MQCPEPTELTRAHALRVDDAVPAHVATCVRCGAEWRELELLAGLARELAWQEPPRDQVGAMRAQIVSSVAPRTGRRAPLVIGIGVALAAAAALIVWLARGDEPAPATYAGAVRPLPRADFALAAPGPDEQVRLWNGTIAVEVNPLAAGERFRVITGDAEVEVRGTAFEVVAANDRLVAVRVTHGRVEIRAQGSAPATIGAGERWEGDVVLAPPQPPAPAVEAGAPTAPTAAAPEQAVAPVRAAAPATAPARERAGGGTSRRSGRSEPAPAPATSDPLAPAPTPTPTPVTPTVTEAKPAPTPPAASDLSTAPATRPTPTVPAHPATPTAPTTTPTPDSDAAKRRQDRREEQREERRDDRRDDRRQERRIDRRDDRRGR